MYQYFVVTITLAVISSILFAQFLDRKCISKKHKVMAVALCTISVALLSSLFPVISGLVMNITSRINEILHISLWTGFSFTVIFIVYLGGILIISVYLSTIVIAANEEEGEVKTASLLALINKLFPRRVGMVLKPAINESSPLENNCVSNYHAAVLQGPLEVEQNILQKPVDSEKNIDTIGIGANDINGEAFDISQEISLKEDMSLEYLIEEDFFIESELPEVEEVINIEEEISIEEVVEAIESDIEVSEIEIEEEPIEAASEEEIQEPEVEEVINIEKEISVEEVVEAIESDIEVSEIEIEEEPIEAASEEEIQEPEVEEVINIEEEISVEEVVEAIESDIEVSEIEIEEEPLEAAFENDTPEIEEELSIEYVETEISEVENQSNQENINNLLDSSLLIHISNETNVNTISDTDNTTSEINSKEGSVVDRLIEEAFILKASGDLEGAIASYMYALENDIEDQVVFWLVLDICVLYKQLGKSDLAKDILESYVANYGNIMDEDVKAQIVCNL